ncbi:DNA cytosine methyltransferase [Rhodococcus pyridinivorans]|uniref:DNA cytosine methyltransferase n=1 Tax=Rhodococcus pyridinivorans TaxID=103816 RepID=UPI001FFFF885|nr:DNA cytosine methyltransferase [Rhodococcus pyridinivorans]UPK62845.1 DNA cytosine methyltransferase [Rhodococcus pyridinivorans]
MTSEGSVTAIDLFCGAGGLASGLRQAGVNVVAGIDVDPDCAFPFTHNNSAEFHLEDIRDITGDDLNSMWESYNGPKLLAGCAPCQPFSTLRQAGLKEKDAKWNLLGEFSRLISESNPEFVTMENVPGLVKTDVFSKFVSNMADQGYSVNYRVVHLPEYGLPQLRKRLVLVASRIAEIHVPDGTHTPECYVTVKEAIGSIPPLEHGQQSPSDPMHRTQALSEMNLKRIRASIPGGTWREWPEELQLDCHKRDTGKYYASVYGRMLWDAPSPTITTQFYIYGTGRFGHPDQDRAISLREGATLQGFPIDYAFVPQGMPYTINKIGRLIGNAVPPVLGRIIGETVLKAARS